MPVRPDMGGVDHIGLHARRLQHVLQPHPGPFRTGDRAIGPLVALGRRIEEGPPVAAALDGQRPGHDLELRLQIGDRIGHRVVDQTVHGQGPGVGVHVVGRDAVVADEMPHRRGDGVVQQMRRGLGIERPVVQQGQPVLADQHILARESGRDQPSRHEPVERDRRPDHRRHRRQTGALEKAAPVGMRHPAEEGAIRRDRILPVEFMDIRSAPGRAVVLGHDVFPCFVLFRYQRGRAQFYSKGLNDPTGVWQIRSVVERAHTLANDGPT